MKTQSALFRSHRETFAFETDYAEAALAEPRGGSIVSHPPELPPADHHGPVPSLAADTQPRARCMLGSGESEHCMVGCSLGEDNVWLPAVKPQIAPSQIWFGD